MAKKNSSLLKNKQRKAAYLQIIRKCNNECVFCSNPQFEKEISYEEARSEIKKLKKEGVNEIFLTGGEPTISQDLFKIIQHLKKTKITPRIITNGVELSKVKLVRNLLEQGVHSVNVSLHSCTEQTSDELSQRKGHFNKSIIGIKNALAAGINVNINCTINEKNKNELVGFAGFITKIFPKIDHFVFNFLDPGMADGNLHSRAHENPWIVARYSDIEEELAKMVELLKKNKKSFRIERVPLCCMSGFEEYSTETRKIVKEELYICSFVEAKNNNKIRKVNPYQLRVKPELCGQCTLNSICAGVQKEYLAIHGDAGLKPSDKSPENIINKILV